MNKKNVLIIDGQGGAMGSALVRAIRARFPNLSLTAVGTNASATAAMLKAGATEAATGENPVLVACRKADVILGPAGIVIADAMLGEVTPAMARAVGQAKARRILIPMNRCETLIAGARSLGTSALLADAVDCLAELIGETAS